MSVDLSAITDVKTADAVLEDTLDTWDSDDRFALVEHREQLASQEQRSAPRKAAPPAERGTAADRRALQKQIGTIDKRLAEEGLDRETEAEVQVDKGVTIAALDALEQRAKWEGQDDDALRVAAEDRLLEREALLEEMKALPALSDPKEARRIPRQRAEARAKELFDEAHEIQTESRRRREAVAAEKAWNQVHARKADAVYQVVQDRWLADLERGAEEWQKVKARAARERVRFEPDPDLIKKIGSFFAADRLSRERTALRGVVGSGRLAASASPGDHLPPSDPRSWPEPLRAFVAQLLKSPAPTELFK